MALCELHEVSRAYGAGPGLVTALDGVSLSIEAGEFTALSGPSGSGKTTLLNLMGCLDVPSRGQILLEGTDVARLSERALCQVRAARVGFVFQSFNLVPVLTALENVELALDLAGAAPRNRSWRAFEALRAVGLAEHAMRRPSQLSGGQQQRVAIARALAKEPALIIADEPTANLDSHNSELVLELMERMNRELGVTLVLSTHDPEVVAVARRVIRLRDGKVQSDGQEVAACSR
jgi:putative ABC transport system ATP-binding protein